MPKILLEIQIDTREQRPYQFDTQYIALQKNFIIKKERASLKTGDYTLKGFESDICIERKSLNDFVSSIRGDKNRFFAELDRMQSYKYRCIIVESTVSEIARGKYHSRVAPNSVLNTAVSIFARFNIPVFFWENRVYSQNMLSYLLYRYYLELTQSAMEIL